jgi:hypothetical protein
VRGIKGSSVLADGRPEFPGMLGIDQGPGPAPPQLDGDVGDWFAVESRKWLFLLFGSGVLRRGGSS